MANKTIQLLRNVGTTYANHDAAVTGLTTQLASCLDGQPILARYNDGSKERTILAIKSQSGYEFFDNAAGNDAITAAINALKNGASEGFDTLKEIEDVIKAMDLAQVGGTAGDVITAVSEEDGQVSASKSSLSDIALTGYSKTDDTGAIAATDTLEEALSKLENKTAAITVASADKTVTVTSPAGGGTDLAVNIDGTTLVKNSSTGVISSDLKIKSIAQAAGSTYASQYQLVYGNSETPIGDVISVAKDQFLKEASFNPSTQVLTLVMYNSTGGTTDITVDFKDVVIEAEAGMGLYVGESEPGVSDGTINIGIDDNSEAVTISDGQGGSTTADVLTVGADSIKVDHIQDAIDYAVNTATNSFAYTDTAVTNQFVIEVDEVDGVISVQRAQPTAGDIATTAITGDTTHVAIAGTDAATQIENISIAIKAEETARTNAIANLDYTDTAVANQFVTEVDEVDGVISVQRAQPAAAGVTVADSGEYFVATNVEGALAELAAFDCGTY